MKKMMTEWLVIDKSGSMANKQDLVVNTINERIQGSKKIAEEQDVDIRFNLFTFDNEVYESVLDTPIKEVKEAGNGDYVPNGGTALYDAMFYVIKTICNQYGTQQDVEHTIIFVTDGEENVSKHCTDPAKIANLIEELKQSNRYTFSFVGCSQEVLQEATKKLNIPISNSAAWNADPAVAGAAMNHMNCRINAMYSKKLSSDAPITEGLYSDVGSQVICDLNQEPNPSYSAVMPTAAVNAQWAVPDLMLHSSFGNKRSKTYNHVVNAPLVKNYATKKADWEKL
jgi:hypothetical protein